MAEEKECCCSHKTKERSEKEYKDMIHRLNRIEGQIRGERAKEMGALLGVPEEYTVAVYLPVGVPAKSMAEAVKKPFSERAWLNGYQKELD